MDSDQTKKKYYKKEELYNTLLRRLSTPLLKLILKTNLTANQISIFWIILYISVILLFLKGTHELVITAVVLKIIADIFDMLNGGIARCKDYPKKKLAKGDYMENITHHIIRPYMIFAIAVGLFLSSKEIIILILGSIAAINSGIIELSINDKRNAINNYLGDSEKIKEDFLKNYLRIKTIATEAYLFFFSFGIIIFSIFGILNSWILLLVVYSTIYLIGKVFYEYTNL